MNFSDAVVLVVSFDLLIIGVVGWVLSAEKTLNLLFDWWFGL